MGGGVLADPKQRMLGSDLPLCRTWLILQSGKLQHIFLGISNDAQSSVCW